MPAIWTRAISCEILHQLHEGTAVRQLGIEFTEVGDDFIAARVPVDARTRQPYGLLHSGVAWCWPRPRLLRRGLHLPKATAPWA